MEGQENDHPVIQLLYGYYYTENGNFELAKPFLEKATASLGESGLAMYLYGRLAMKSGNLQEALTAFAKASHIDPDLHAAQLDQASVLISLERPEEAIAIYNHALQQHILPASDLFRNRSIARFFNGDLEGALSDIERGFAEVDDPKELYHLLTGTIHFLYGDMNLAVEHFTSVIRLDRENKTAYYHRGLALLLHYNRADACYDLERSAQLGLERGALKQRYFCTY